MKALTIHEYGGALQQEQVEQPKPSAGQVVVRNSATSFNPLDPGKASGAMRQMFQLQFPWVPGGDLSGTVHEVGEGVSHFKPGDEVFGYSATGGAYAEFIAVDAGAIALRPDSLSTQEGAAVAVVGQTAMQSLDLAKVKAGSKILVHGGAGGVGSLAIQLASQAGARVYTTAREEQRETLLDLGADVVIDFTKQQFDQLGETFDAVLATIAGETLARSYAVVKPGGVIVTFNQPPDPAECEKRGIKGFFVQTQVTTDGLMKFAGLVTNGDIEPLIAHEQTLWDPAKLWAKKPAGNSVGKVVFTI